MAYTAVTCLRTTIRRLLNSSRIPVVSSHRGNLEFAYDELGSLQKVLKRSDGCSSLNGQIIGAVQELEDLLEFHELDQIRAQSESYGDQELMRDISSSVETVNKIKQEYCTELNISLPEKGDDDDDDDGDYDEEEDEEEDDDDADYDDNPLEEDDEEEDAADYDDNPLEEEEEEEEGGDGDGNDFSWNMVGLSYQFDDIKENLFGYADCYIFSIVGMAGIGKTALAQRILNDVSIRKKFKCRAFVRVGQNFELQELEKGILDQVNPNNEKHEGLNEYLDDKRYLIVLDDVWNLGFWDKCFKYRRGDKSNGSLILLTTRIEGLLYSLPISGAYYYMPFLNKEESWDLLRREVFAEKVCPPELYNTGKEIARKCDGLPLMLVKVAGILSKPETTQEHWKEAAQNKKSRVFEDAYDQILPVLYPSYQNLPPQEKACFLYMAAFPPYHEVCRSKLVHLWCTEGFLEPEDSTPIKCVASECFHRLAFDHVVVHASKLSSDSQNYQAYSLHSVFRHLCKKELENNVFLHIIQSSEDGSTLGRKGSARRVSIYYNVLLSIEKVYTSIESPTTRSLLCTGAHHKYEVPVINIELKLLRVCDALTIRFYEFPLQVLELFQLRYLAITCDENLPPSIDI